MKKTILALLPVVALFFMVMALRHLLGDEWSGIVLLSLSAIVVSIVSLLKENEWWGSYAIFYATVLTAFVGGFQFLSDYHSKIEEQSNVAIPWAKISDNKVSISLTNQGYSSVFGLSYTVEAHYRPITSSNKALQSVELVKEGRPLVIGEFPKSMFSQPLYSIDLSNIAAEAIGIKVKIRARNGAFIWVFYFRKNDEQKWSHAKRMFFEDIYEIPPVCEDFSGAHPFPRYEDGNMHWFYGLHETYQEAKGMKTTSGCSLYRLDLAPWRAHYDKLP